MASPTLFWLPPHTAWPQALAAAASAETDWPAFVGLANYRLDMVATLALDRRLQARFAAPPDGLATRPVRLAVLGSATLDHLLPAIRVGGLRRGLHVTLLTGDYGQYAALADPEDPLWAQAPNAVLLALDARHITAGLSPIAPQAEVAAHLDRLFARLERLWQAARQHGAVVIQQAALPVLPPLLGEAEHALPASPAAVLAAFNARLRGQAAEAGILVLSVDRHAAEDGIDAWHSPTLWHRAKQEIHPAAAAFYGDLVGRLLAAQQGRSAKCLVLDLDNTVWGGVIGDDGVEGLVLGQGSALGEAFVAFQGYARALGQRGVILAVCSKNDEANALAGFDRHPDMVLRRSDIACFVANWEDKAHNLRRIAETLNIGIDALVFADDNPAERAIVRRELPAVAVPELPADPALYAATLARAGYFEATALTADDLSRAEQYQQNRLRASLADSATDMEGYLQSLDMVGQWSAFRRIDRARVVQLINKTNQFNLTTRRYTEAEVEAAMADPRIATLQLRLLDQFGDNGLIALAILRPDDTGRRYEIDTWLMSCRVLKRGVETAMLNLLAEQARGLGAAALRGRYRPTAKNAMVAAHYETLGFAPDGAEGEDTLWRLDLATFTPRPHFIRLVETLEAAAA